MTHRSSALKAYAQGRISALYFIHAWDCTVCWSGDGEVLPFEQWWISYCIFPT